MLRPIIVSTVLGAVVGSVLAAGVPCARAEDPSSTVSIDNFTFGPQTLKVKAGTTVTWINEDDIPHGIAATNNAFKKSQALDTDDSYSFTFTTPGTYQAICTLTWLARSSWKQRLGKPFTSFYEVNIEPSRIMVARLFADRDIERNQGARCLRLAQS